MFPCEENTQNRPSHMYFEPVDFSCVHFFFFVCVRLIGFFFVSLFNIVHVFSLYNRAMTILQFECSYVNVIVCISATHCSQIVFAWLFPTREFLTVFFLSFFKRKTFLFVSLLLRSTAWKHALVAFCVGLYAESVTKKPTYATSSSKLPRCTSSLRKLFPALLKCNGCPI